jgi:hypothetical protein
MSLLNIIEEKAEYLLSELKVRAVQQQRDHGHIADDLQEIIDGLENYVVAPVNNVISEPVIEVVEEVQLVAPTPVAVTLTCVAPK